RICTNLAIWLDQEPTELHNILSCSINFYVSGILSQDLGFLSILWFLTTASGISLLSTLVLLPGTLRPIAGNGTIPLKGYPQTLHLYVTGQKGAREGTKPRLEKSRITFKGIFSPLRFLAEKDVFITLFFGSIVYTVWSM